MRAVILSITLFVLFLQPQAVVFSGSGSYDMKPGDSIVFENNSTLNVSTIYPTYVFIEFFGPYAIRKPSRELYENDFGKIIKYEAVGIKFSAQPERKPDGNYTLLINASMLAANLKAKPVFKTIGKLFPGGPISASQLVSELTVENTGDLSLDQINTVFSLIRNGEEIFFSENKSAIERLGPGESARVRVENATWSLTPTRPGIIDNFTFKIIVARNQFKETDLSDNEITIPLEFQEATPTPVPTTTPLPTAIATATPTPTASLQATPAPGVEMPPLDFGITLVIILVVVGGAILFFTWRGSKPGKG